MAFSLYICLNPTLGCLWTVSSLFYFWICWYAERVPPLSTQAANNRACAQERQLPPCNCRCSPQGQGCHHVYCGNNEGSDGNTSLKASLVRSCPIYRLYTYSLFFVIIFVCNNYFYETISKSSDKPIVKAQGEDVQWWRCSRVTAEPFFCSKSNCLENLNSIHFLVIQRHKHGHN